MLGKRIPQRTKIYFIFAVIGLIIVGAAVVYLIAPPRTSTTIVVEHWTELVEPDRQIILNQLAEDFMEENQGIEVVIVPVPEDDFPERLAEAKEANALPDTVRVGFGHVGGWTLEGILDPGPAQEIIDELGGDTWGAGTLELFRSPSGEGSAAVPSDGWLQGIWYRKDLFEAAGLDPPTTWDAILEACRALNNPTEGFYGIMLGTNPETVYTQQCYEAFALSIDARAFDYYTREPTLDTHEQAATLEFYAELASYAPATPITWEDANEYYLTGNSAMMIYSTYIIDDILGVDKRDWTPIPQLSEKTGFVSTIEGPSGKKSAWGELYGFGISTTADKEAAKAWIKYILEERLYDYVSISIVGMLPARNTIIERWKEHEYFAEYSPELADQIISGFNFIERWGYQDGKVFPGVAELYSELPIPQVIGKLLEGELTPAEAAQWVQDVMEELTQE